MAAHPSDDILTEHLYRLLADAGWAVELRNVDAIAVHPDRPGIVVYGHGESDYSVMVDLCRACEVRFS